MVMRCFPPYTERTGVSQLRRNRSWVSQLNQGFRPGERMTNQRLWIPAVLLLATPHAVASVFAVNLSDFPGGSPVITFNGLSGNADGATVNGVTFHYPAGGLTF